MNKRSGKLYWYQLQPEEAVSQLQSDAAYGLTETEATRRLAEFGPNELVDRGRKNPWLIFWEQLTSVLILVLIVAAIASAFLGDYKDAAAILAIVVLNAVLGFRQEYQAERAIAALKRLAVPNVKVRRGGHVLEISARTLVPGDIVLLEAGNLIPADGRLLQSVNLRVDEAALTGESEPVEKEVDVAFDAEKSLGDRCNMVHRGTAVTYGHGTAVITETGMQTELGRIAELIQTVTSGPTPLQLRLDQLGRWLALIALLIVAVIFGLGWLRGEDLHLMLLTAISMAVAAVPEGLPAVVTIALALGAQRMLRRHALMRKLPAVETLGSVTVICSDKTGTLTESKMTVTVLDVAGEHINLSEHLQRGRTGAIRVPFGRGTAAPIAAQPALSLLLAGGALCNDVFLETDDSQMQDYRIVGDPTEGALAVAAARAGLEKANLEGMFPRVAEVPFDSVRKRMTTVHALPPANAELPEGLSSLRAWGADHGAPSYLAFTKGAMDSLLQISDRVWIDGQVLLMNEEFRARIEAAHNRLADEGMRVLGVAVRGWELIPEPTESEILERDLIFVGLTAMIDPPRAEVRDAVQTCKQAGIRTMMITGDHPLTARYIANELDIGSGETLITGQDLDQLAAQDLAGVVQDSNVYARVSPEHKLNIVQALQDSGHIVAMTGDGVNDAPALKKADIGVSMGITGTDVAKEAAEMVLQDDNFATIVAAIEEGRTIYDNIRKFIKYLLSCNSGELWVMLLAPFLGMPLPLLPLQILWMNLVTDGLPALALGVEPAESNVMKRPPYPTTESVFSRGAGFDIVWIGLLMGLVPLVLSYVYWQGGNPGWQTVAFTTLTLSQMAVALALRSERDSLFSIGLLTNRAMIGAVSLTFVLQLAVIYTPVLQTFFNTSPLTLQDLGVSLLLCTVPFWFLELKKWIVRHQAGQLDNFTQSDPKASSVPSQEFSPVRHRHCGEGDNVPLANSKSGRCH